MVPEASSIIEYLDVHHPGPVRLIPDDPDAALEVRMMDRFFDNYVATPQQKLVFDRIRPRRSATQRGVAEARAMLDTAYAWLDTDGGPRMGRGRLQPGRLSRPRRRFSTPTGAIRSTGASPMSPPIASG